MEIPNPDKSDYGYADFIKGIDALVMGRNTFEKVLTFGEWSYVKPVFVLSNTLIELPESVASKAEIIKGDLKNIISQLEVKGDSNFYIDGGKVIQSFLKEDLIDEMIITRIPVLLGKGISLFGENDSILKFKHTKTEIFNETLVRSNYVRVREK